MLTRYFQKIGDLQYDLANHFTIDVENLTQSIVQRFRNIDALTRALNIDSLLVVSLFYGILRNTKLEVIAFIKLLKLLSYIFTFVNICSKICTALIRVHGCQ